MQRARLNVVESPKPVAFPTASQQYCTASVPRRRGAVSSVGLPSRPRLRRDGRHHRSKLTTSPRTPRRSTASLTSAPSITSEEWADPVELDETEPLEVYYSSDKSTLDLEQVRELWRVAFGRLCTLETIQTAIQNSFTIQAAYVANGEERELIGLARCLSDEVFAALFADVCVAPGYQRRGIGSDLVKTLCEQTRDLGPQGFAAFPTEESWRFLWSCGFRWNKRFSVMTYAP